MAAVLNHDTTILQLPSSPSSQLSIRLSWHEEGGWREGGERGTFVSH